MDKPNDAKAVKAAGEKAKKRDEEASRNAPKAKKNPQFHEQHGERPNPDNTGVFVDPKAPPGTTAPQVKSGAPNRSDGSGGHSSSPASTGATHDSSGAAAARGTSNG